MLPITINIREAYKHGKDDEQNFIQNLSLFLCCYLKEHGTLIEKRKECNETLLEALQYLILISEVDETEIFKICLEYWSNLASELYRENPFKRSAPSHVSTAPVAACNRMTSSIRPPEITYLFMCRCCHLPRLCRIAPTQIHQAVETFITPFCPRFVQEKHSSLNRGTRFKCV